MWGFSQGEIFRLSVLKAQGILMAPTLALLDISVEPSHYFLSGVPAEHLTATRPFFRGSVD